jgi:hypothetical protein
MRERRDSTPFLGSNREVDGAAEIAAVGAVIDLDQHREHLSSKSGTHRLGPLT